MSLQDTDAFIVSDTAGTNYQVAASDMANYVNSLASGGGGGMGGGNMVFVIEMNEFLYIAGQYDGIRCSIAPTYTTDTHGDFAKVGGNAQNKEMVYLAAHPFNVPSTPSGGANQSGALFGSYVWPDVRGMTIGDPAAVTTTFKVHSNWSIASILYQRDGNGSHMVCSQFCTDIFLYGNIFHTGTTANYWPILASIQGDGQIAGTVTRMANLTTISPNVRFGFEPGDLDFSETALSAETIEHWLTGDYLKEGESLGGVFKTIRLEGGTVASYEDLSDVAKEAITTLQGLGYTIVMNGTGDSTTVNVSAGNAGLIITTSDGKYIPVKASTSDAIFPPTGYTNITEFATLDDILTAIQVNLPDFNGDRLFGNLLIDEDVDARRVEVVQNLATAVTLDATPTSTIPSGTTLSYKWYKDEVSIGGPAEIPNATSATISTASLTADQIGSYTCEITAENTSTARKMTIYKNFSVSEPTAPVPSSELMG